MSTARPPSRSVTLAFASLYIASGICQPLLMTACKGAGLADAKAQMYMFFYYLGPASMALTFFHDYYSHKNGSISPGDLSNSIPTRAAVLKACVIAVFDIISQGLNYTGAGLAGSTIFAVIYSSVTIWTAIWSRLFLKRSLGWMQWVAVWVVFGGLALTALDSVNMGSNVKQGAALVIAGSAMHGAAYVLSEAVMNHGPESERLTVRQNTAIQGLLATIALGIWQVVYTLPRWDVVVAEPARRAGTSLASAALLLSAFAFANMLHAGSFYFTLKNYPGGATSAGVMKGLQAVLVFGATHVLFCGRTGGAEMCFSVHKLISLITVVTGVALFGVATERQEQPDVDVTKEGYSKIQTADDVGSFSAEYSNDSGSYHDVIEETVQHGPMTV